MQAFSRWERPVGVLAAILEATHERVAALRLERTRLERRAREVPEGPPLMDALRRPEVAVIAEVKRKSPSKGEIAGGLSASDQASAYHRGGAAAVSVLTEPRWFSGDPADLEAARAAVPIPIVKKDFHVDEVQVIEARALGASGVLLIARALEPAALTMLVACALDHSVEPVVEVRDEDELERAITSGARIIGINNRNLETLAIDPATAERLLPLIPHDRVAIAESGMSSRKDVERYARAGADAVLIGSHVSAAPNPASAVSELTGVRRSGRGR